MFIFTNWEWKCGSNWWMQVLNKQWLFVLWATLIMACVFHSGEAVEHSAGWGSLSQPGSRELQLQQPRQHPGVPLWTYWHYYLYITILFIQLYLASIVSGARMMHWMCCWSVHSSIFSLSSILLHYLLCINYIVPVSSQEKIWLKCSQSVKILSINNTSYTQNGPSCLLFIYQ